MGDPPVEFVWHDDPVPAGLPITQVYGWLLGYQEVRQPGQPVIAQLRMAGIITEFAARAPDPDNGRLNRRYVAVADSPHPVGQPEHQVRWFTPADISAMPGISEDSRTLATRLLNLAAPQQGPSFQWPPETRHSTPAGRQADWTATGPSARTGSDPAESPRLIVIRGNSASGKSEAAAKIREKYGRHGLAIVGQDNLRRVVLREHDVPGGANIDLIDLTARFALSRGYHTIVEGIFNADHYAPMLTALISDHPGSAFAYFLDVPFPETLRRHATKTGTPGYGEAEMRQWYRGLDLLPGGIEHVIPAESSLEETVSTMMADAGLDTRT
jgi:hypothetical protein